MILNLKMMHIFLPKADRSMKQESLNIRIPKVTSQLWNQIFDFYLTNPCSRIYWSKHQSSRCFQFFPCLSLMILQKHLQLPKKMIVIIILKCTTLRLMTCHLKRRLVEQQILISSSKKLNRTPKVKSLQLFTMMMEFGSLERLEKYQEVNRKSKKMKLTSMIWLDLITTQCVMRCSQIPLEHAAGSEMTKFLWRFSIITPEHIIIWWSILETERLSEK